VHTKGRVRSPSRLCGAAGASARCLRSARSAARGATSSTDVGARPPTPPAPAARTSNGTTAEMTAAGKQHGGGIGAQRGDTLSQPSNQGARRRRESNSGGDKESLPRLWGAHQAKPVHQGAHVATLRCSTTAGHERTDTPAPAAAGPPAPAAEKSSRATEEARWRRHLAPGERAARRQERGSALIHAAPRG